MGSLQSSPVRKQPLIFKSPSTCPSSTCPSATSTPSSTPKHSVHFHDPQLMKGGLLVTKVQCKLMTARDLLLGERSPIRVIQLRETPSPLKSPSPIMFSRTPSPLSSEIQTMKSPSHRNGVSERENNCISTRTH